MRRRRLLKNDSASAVLETMVSVGISITLLTVFFYSTNTLYTVQDEPGVDLEAKSVGLMETLINSPGQLNSYYPEWQSTPGVLKTLGLGTSQTIQYGTMYTDPTGEITVKDGPYPDSSIGVVETCFLAGTQIVMADESYKNIEDIEVGDLVKSYDEKSEEIVDRPVVHVFHHTPDEMGDYYLVINNQLRVTPNHEFFIDGEWIYADELSIGNSLFYPSSDYEIFSIEEVFERTYTYNFEVEGHHNYFVAMEPTNALVHNGEGVPQHIAPVAGFTWDPQDPYPGQPIEFNGEPPNSVSGYGGITLYEWDFDNYGGYEVSGAEEGIVEHTFYSANTYPVKLRVTDGDDCVSSAEENDITVQSGPFPLESYIDAWAEGQPINGHEPLTVTFHADVDYLDWRDKPYTCTWDFDDGTPLEIYDNLYQPWLSGSNGLPWEPDGLEHEFSGRAAPYIVKFTITSDDGYQEGSVIFDGGIGNPPSIIVEPLPEGYFEPSAHFIWSDSDGPYSGGTEICFDPTYSDYFGGVATFKWYSPVHFLIETTDHLNPIFYYDDWGDNPDESNPHEVRLEVWDDSDRYDEYEETVQANEPDPVEPDTKPWVLAGKDISPDSDDDTFSSYAAGYYTTYTDPKPPSNIRIFEVKEKATSDQPILNYTKIKVLCEGSYNNFYEDIKSNLGLVSDQALYNFQIKIEIPNDPASPYIYGASDDTAVAKESTTRKVLIYRGPTAKQGIVSANDWKIDSHPEYLPAEITLSVFLGGTPPPVP